MDANGDAVGRRKLARWWTFGKRLLRVVAVFWMTAVGGILGANLLAFIGTQFFVNRNAAEYVRPWSHVGWCLGALLFFFAAVTGRLRFINGSGLGNRSAATAKDPSIGNDGVEVAAKSERYEATSGALGFVLAGGLAGGILGFLLGANLLIFWFSLAYSPFAPRQVVSSVEVVREDRPGSVFKRPLMRSSHPVALSICLVPAAIGILAGVTAAGIIAWRYRDNAQTPSS